MNSRRLTLLFMVGLAALAIGVYSVFYKPTHVASQSKSALTIPKSAYSTYKWDEYGIGREGDQREPINIWMRAVGSITYPFSVPKIEGEEATVMVKLSSELGPKVEGTVNGDPKYSSDVVLVVNDVEYISQNVSPDDGQGKFYSWTIPAHTLKVGNENSLSLVIKKDAKHKNGLTIFSPIEIQFK